MAGVLERRVPFWQGVATIAVVVLAALLFAWWRSIEGARAAPDNAPVVVVAGSEPTPVPTRFVTPSPPAAGRARDRVAAPLPARHDNVPSPGFILRLERGDAPGRPGARVRLTWTGAPQGAELFAFRATRMLELTGLDEVRYPICRSSVTQQPHDDDSLADGVSYGFQLAARLPDGSWRYSTIVSIATPARALPTVVAPSILVDKSSYYLEVRSAGRYVKRYPIALGRNPQRRKLHQDNACTPEGRYRISGLQPTATFYRAYDLDYPNEADRIRYDVARRLGRLPSAECSIGGEIQIHGKGIHANWTFGCVALRNEDMDELFSHPEIAEGLSVHIVGRDMQRADLDPPDAAAIRDAQARLQRLGFYRSSVDGELGEATMRAIGAFQVAHDLPLSCQLDARTVDALGK